MLTGFLTSMGFDFLGRSPALFALGFAASFLFMLVFGRSFVNAMRRWQKKGQPISENAPQSHLAKAGTPTMGGLLMILAIAVSSLLFMDWHNPIPWVALAAMLWFGAIGFCDDFKKVRSQNRTSRNGLSAKSRLALGGVGAIILAYFVNEVQPAYLLDLSVAVPIFHKLLPIGWLYFVFAYFVIVGSANAANITDGLDGMLSKIMLPALAVLAVALFGATHAGFFEGSVFLPEAAGLYPVLGAALGAVLGFLWFNSAPAAIFMGDTGSLAIGGFFGTVAMLLKVEVVAGIAALMLVLILGSTFLQTIFFKLTRALTGTGRRIFKMAPLHHHFELSGWAETKIVERFFILSILFGAIAIAILRA
jgi:phospho-N-acetylmuramoyl-pentapeptide-transferase